MAGNSASSSLIDLGSAHLSESHGKPRVVIGPGSVVKGPLNFERDVDLYVSDHATIGTVTGATPIRFSGDRPQAPGAREVP